jgi:hypothetical protein
MKRTITLFSCLLLLGVFTGCDKDEDENNDEMWNVSTTMSGANEVPAVTTAATGSVTGTYNATTNALQYNVTWSGLSGTATVGHFHGAALAGFNASPIIHFNLVNNGTSGTAAATVTLTEAQETDLLAGKWYANIHTGANTGGEIRGQLVTTRQ